MTAATMTKDRPILFSGPMVRALLAGTKTQTRRIMKPQPTSNGYVSGGVLRCRNDFIPPDKYLWKDGGVIGYDAEMMCPYGYHGDRLWVRETFAFIDNSDFVDESDPEFQYYEYRADGDEDRLPGDWPSEERDNPERPRWQPSIHMPRKASRLSFTIIDVHVQRLQDISEDDALAEGVRRIDTIWYEVAGFPQTRGLAAKVAFMHLWNTINGHGSWDANPWVWAITFERVEA